MKKLQTIRQGDLLFIPTSRESVFEWLDGTLRNTKGIIRQGEATGHHHRLAEPASAQVFQPSGWRAPAAIVCTGDVPAVIVHEEHKPVRLASNTTYKVHVARELDYLADRTPRYVRD